MHHSEDHAADTHGIFTLQDVPVDVQLQRVLEIVAIWEMLQRRQHLLTTVQAYALGSLPIPDNDILVVV